MEKENVAGLTDNDITTTEAQGQIVTVTVPPEDSIEIDNRHNNDQENSDSENDVEDVYEELSGKSYDTNSEIDPDYISAYEEATDSEVSEDEDSVDDEVGNAPSEPENAVPLNEMEALVESDSLEESSEDDPISHKGTWDSPLPTIRPGTVKRIWVKGKLEEKLQQCQHEQIEVYCECAEKKKLIICRLCHSLMCTDECRKRTGWGAATIAHKSLPGGKDEVDYAVPGTSNKKSMLPLEAGAIATIKPQRTEELKVAKVTHEVGSLSLGRSDSDQYQSNASISQQGPSNNSGNHPSQQLSNTRKVMEQKQELPWWSSTPGSSTKPANAEAANSTFILDSVNKCVAHRPVEKIRLNPDVPVGIKLLGVYIHGESFSDFSIVEQVDYINYRDVDSSLQECTKELLSPIGPQDVCMVQWQPHKEGSSIKWYRGIIMEADRVSVYLVDVGVQTDVPRSSIYKLPSEFTRIRPFAIRMNCLNVKEEGADAKRLEEHFHSLVKSQCVKITITHKSVEKPFTYAGNVHVLYIEKWFDAGVLLEKCRVTEIVSDEDITAMWMYQPFSIVDSQVSECQPPKLRESTFPAIILNVESVNEFYVTNAELVAKRALLETPLQNGNGESISVMQNLSESLFIMFDTERERWIRVKVLEVLGSTRVVVRKIDYCETVTVSIASIERVPRISREPGCVYKCALPPKPTQGFRRWIPGQPLVKDDLPNILHQLCAKEELLTIRVLNLEATNTHIVQVNSPWDIITLG